MPKFLVTYHGGTMPESAEGREQAEAAFAEWAGAAGKALADPGAPLGASKTVTAGSVADGPAQGPAAGYSILDAPDLDSAVDLVRGHPFIGRGGALQVSQAITP